MNKKLHIILSLCLGISVLLPGCTEGEPLETAPRFELLTAEQTGLAFENVLTQSATFNVFEYMYFFNGGGVSVADYNQDGQMDLFFTSNMGPNKMFLNEGNLRFKDITTEAGVSGQEGWTSGTSVVDINQDGWPDLYVSQLGNFGQMQGTNQLYICKGIEKRNPAI